MFRLSSRTAGGRTGEPPSRARVALAFGGVAFTAVQLVIGSQMGIFPIPPGDELIWDRVGDAIWTGGPIYYNAPVLTDSFWYAPPIAVLFGTVSWLPLLGQHVLFTVLRIASLRVIAGSWLGAGIACWFPLVAFELGGGNFNLLIAAGIVAAIQRRPELATITVFAKFGPALALDPRDWRRVAVVVGVLVAITLPWLHLWPEFVNHLEDNLSSQLGPQVPVPFPIRFVAALALLGLVRQPWSRALAATLAIPAFYWGSLVILIAPVAILLRGRRTVEPLALRAVPA
jgi:hypothetical protein